MKKFESRGMISDGISELPNGASCLPFLAVVKDSDRIKYLNGGHSILPVRLCLDAKKGLVNEHTDRWPMRYAGIDHAAALIKKDKYISCLDISSFFPSCPLVKSFSEKYAYFSDPMREPVDIAHHCRPMREVNVKLPRYRRFKGIYFGLKTASPFTSMVSGEIQKICNCSNYNVTFYSDDGLIVADGGSAKECENALKHCIDTIRELGLDVANEKVVYPTKVIDYLGATFNSENMTITPKEDSITHIRQWLVKIRKEGKIHRTE